MYYEFSSASCAHCGKNIDCDKDCNHNNHVGERGNHKFTADGWINTWLGHLCDVCSPESRKILDSAQEFRTLANNRPEPNHVVENGSQK